MAQVKIKNNRFRFLRLSSTYTLIFSLLLGAILSLLYLFITNKFTEQSLDKLDKRAQFISSFVVNKIEMSVSTGDSAKIDKILKDVFIENGLRYVVLSASNNTFFKAFNLKEAEENLYTITGKDKAFSADNKTFKTVKPVKLKDNPACHIYLGFNSAVYIREVNNIKHTIGFTFIIFLAFGTIIFYILSHILTSPVRKMVNNAVKLSNGDLNYRIKTKSKSELGILAKSFDVLAEDLEIAYARIESLNHQLKGYFKDKIGELNLEINKRRKIEDNLRQSEENFRLLFELAPIGMIQSLVDGKIEKVNNAFCEALGFHPNEVLDMFILDLTYIEDREKDKKYYEELLSGSIQFINYEKRLLRKDNKVIHTIFESVLVRDNDGQPLHFISQFIDITERKRVEVELIEAKEKAERSDQLKSAFLAQMSHEIRTPLNVILTATPMLAEDMEEDPEGSRCLLESVSSAGKRLQRTIDLILNMSAIQSGNYKPEFEVIDIVSDLRKLSEEFRGMCTEKNLDLSFINNVKHPQIYADSYTVNQIFQNIIGNAVKYTLRGKIEIIVSDEESSKLKIEIKDTGIGISEEYLNNLFKPFSQEDAGQKREFEGNGLGLALVKKYVEINKAEIFVKSKKKLGSVFTIVFDKFFESKSSGKLTFGQILKKAGIKS